MKDYIKDTLNYYDNKNLSINEDMYIAYKLITNDYKIKYCLGTFSENEGECYWKSNDIEYDESFDNQWNPNFKIEPVKLGNRNDLGFQLGSVLNLNLDVISTFGLKFAASLQASIEENDTQVFADTKASQP